MNTILGMFVLLYPFSLWIVIFIGTLIAAVIIGKIASAKGKNGFRWGFSVIGLVALYTFWDWPLTVMAHKYYCEKEAGFWVYKTLEQWKAENPGVFETLTKSNKKSERQPLGTRGYIAKYYINNRIAAFSKINIGPHFINVWESGDGFIDIKTGEVLAKSVDFHTGVYQNSTDSVKFWLFVDKCSSFNNQNRSEYLNFYNQFKGE